MGAFLVVVSRPILQLFTGICKAQEPVGVEAFCPEASVEGFDERVVGGRPCSAEVECDAVGVSPQIQVAGDLLPEIALDLR